MNIAIIQARMASKRLSGKALLEIGDIPLINFVIERTMRIKGIDKCFLATSASNENDSLENVAKEQGIDVLRGDEDNVIERFYNIAKEVKPENILRITGDNPLIDYDILSMVLQNHIENNNDYTCTSGFPVGITGDVFSYNALSETHSNANGKELQDHVDMYVLENQSEFKCSCNFLDRYMSNFRLTVDDEEDFQRISKLYDFAKSKNIDLLELTFKQLHSFVGQYIWEKNLQPKNTNVSKENLETYKLVKKIKNRVPVWFNDL
jgi:spore coat polysaccharide biosynthesis protein SpsF (cytidylyltransferase family)